MVAAVGGCELCSSRPPAVAVRCRLAGVAAADGRGGGRLAAVGRAGEREFCPSRRPAVAVRYRIAPGAGGGCVDSFWPL